MDVNDVAENNDSFEVETNLELHTKILENLEKKYSVAKFSSIEWKPINSIEISNEDEAKGLILLLEKLEELDDVQNVFSNFNINDLLMEKLI